MATASVGKVEVATRADAVWRLVCIAFLDHSLASMITLTHTLALSCGRCRKVGTEPGQSTLHHRDELVMSQLPASAAPATTASAGDGDDAVAGVSIPIPPPARGVSVMEPSDEELMLGGELSRWVFAIACRSSAVAPAPGTVNLVAGTRGGAIAMWYRRPQLL